MSEAVAYEQLDQSPEPVGPLGGAPTAQNGADLRRLSDVPMELSVEIGRTRMTVGETLQLRPGSIVTLERLAGEPVDLLVNGTPIARGEVVIVDEEFGLRVTEIVEADSAAESLGEWAVEAQNGEQIAAAGEGGGGEQIDTSPAQDDPATQE
jgi:flagellar motor switch protein FliN/FliY